ncbi:MAG: fructose-1,6-bisphosphatase [Firmicutes bacterium]|nr:fructose-1,6-bisphosphatase [Bacillota bacterium]
MRTTLSVIKADIGSVGGHTLPSQRVLEVVRERVFAERGKLLVDAYVAHTGDDVCLILSHRHGVGHPDVHALAWEAFRAGAEVAKRQGLYGAGQDLLKDAFSGNVRGLGPAAAEMEFEERPNEAVVVFAADKTEPGAFNLPLYLAFADPMYSSGLLLSPELHQGFRFRIMDVDYTEGDRTITLDAPERLYDIAALLREVQRVAGRDDRIECRKPGGAVVGMELVGPLLDRRLHLAVAELAVAGLGDHEARPAEQGVRALCRHERRGDAVDHARLEHEVAPAFLPTPADRE